MPLEVTFLGTGGAFTDFRVNYHNNLLVRTGEGPVIIDCGGTAPQSLRELGVRPWEVRAVLVTHLHGDHVGGIEQLLWERFYTGTDGPGFKPTPLYAPTDVMPDVIQTLEPLLREYTAPSGELRLDGVHALLRTYEMPPCSGRGRPLDHPPTVIGGVRFTMHRTPHVTSLDGTVDKPSYGVRIVSEDGHCVYFTSDTVFRADVGERFPSAVRIFHDCTFTPTFRGTVHTHYEQLLSLPPEVRSRIVLMHHTRVPEGIDPLADGFRAVADRHSTFRLG